MESEARVAFYQIDLASHVVNSDNERLLATVHFKLTMYGKTKDLIAYVRQDAGDSFTYESEPLNVEILEGISGPFNYEFFRKQAEAYYRSSIGKNGGVFNVAPEAKGVGFKDFAMVGEERRIIFKVRDNSPAW